VAAPLCFYASFHHVQAPMSGSQKGQRGVIGSTIPDAACVTVTGLCERSVRLPERSSRIGSWENGQKGNDFAAVEGSLVLTLPCAG
jgi:hypothetical protein